MVFTMILNLLKLMENKIIGSRETHRIVNRSYTGEAPMGKVIKDHGGIIL